MRRADVQRQSDRRLEILDAAQRCFARSGFHGASMQEICAEADMSPGNLYRYFPSKEALIAGICDGRASIKEGEVADLVLVPAESLDDALARRPAGRVVFKAGRRVCGPQPA